MTLTTFQQTSSKNIAQHRWMRVISAF